MNNTDNFIARLDAPLDELQLPDSTTKENLLWFSELWLRNELHQQRSICRNTTLLFNDKILNNLIPEEPEYEKVITRNWFGIKTESLIKNIVTFKWRKDFNNIFGFKAKYQDNK